MEEDAFSDAFSGTNGMTPISSFAPVEEPTEEDKLRDLLVRYFIESGIPFTHVESEVFKALMNELKPRFKLPCHVTIQKDCIKLYMEEKLKLKALLNGQRVCLTTNTWTSLHNLNYMCVTAHFIDSDWIMHKKILKFCPIPDYKGETIGRVLETLLLEWGIDSIFTITVDNASSNDVCIEYMKGMMKDKNFTVLGGEFLHMRCVAHILNLVVNDSLKDVNDAICNVRNAVIYVRSSPARMKKFKECIERENIQYKKLYLDVPIKWNSTYLMLNIAEKYQRAFELMGEEDNQLVVPGFLDWENVRVCVKFLKTFYDATLKISGSTHVTSNRYFMDLYIIQDTLNNRCLSSDPIMSTMGINIRHKYEKYWGNMDKINLMLYVAFVFDPRYKMKGLMFWLKRSNEQEWADQIETKVRDILKRLIEQYSKFHKGVVSRFNVANDTEDALDQFNSLFYRHLVEEDDLKCRSDVDRYLSDGCEKMTEKFDALAWWKMNAPKYPILAKIAHDVLAIPISAVAPEFAFSTGGHVLDPFRSSLSPLTVDALICTQNWIRSNPIDIQELEEFVESDDEQGKCLLIR
jgi:hypothetical protein